jgi:hypothetical protein
VKVFVSLSFDPGIVSVLSVFSVVNAFALCLCLLIQECSPW